MSAASALACAIATSHLAFVLAYECGQKESQSQSQSHIGGFIAYALLCASIGFAGLAGSVLTGSALTGSALTQ